MCEVQILRKIERHLFKREVVILDLMLKELKIQNRKFDPYFTILKNGGSGEMVQQFERRLFFQGT